MRAGLKRSLIMLLLGTTAATAQDMRIQFAEPIALDARPGHVEFLAYGRRFDLTLESNARLLKALPAARKAELASSQLLRGQVDGVAHSWVRLAIVGRGVEGAFWDGHDLYAITTRARIDSMLTSPLATRPDQTVVYRLSDAIGGLGRAFCAVTPAREAALPGDTPLEKYRQMVGELRAQAMTVTPTDQVELSLVGDSFFQAEFGANATEEMLARLNIVDGIFSGQVGVLILATDVRLLASGSEPFSSNDPDTLLDQLANFRDATPALRARGLTHLITGRDLTGNVNGIAYIGTVCDRRLGASLSDTSWATLTAAQVMAHELGHNFGAEHDGVAGGACAGTPQNFLMAPNVNGSGTFSSCSLTTMAPVIAAARTRCVVPAAYGDVDLEGPAGPTTADEDSSFVLPFHVVSAGNRPAQQVTLVATLPAGLSFLSGTVAGGSCGLSGANDVTCALGDLAPDEQRTVSLTLMGSQPAMLNVHAHLDADNDFLHGNDDADAAVTIRSAIDVGVRLSASAATVYSNDAVDYTFDVSATRSRLVHGATLDVDLAALTVESISAGANSCSITQGISFRCQLVDLAPGAHTTVIAHARAGNPGEWPQTAYVNVAGDGDATDNNDHVMTQVKAERGVSMIQSSADFSAVLGQSYENTYTLTALGRLNTADVRFELAAMRTGVIESVTPDAGSCTDLGGLFPAARFRCSFGTLSPGDTRSVVVRFHEDREALDGLAAAAIYFNGTQDIRQQVDANVHAAPAADVALDAGLGGPVTEGLPSFGSISVRAGGINASQNVVVTLDLPAPMQLTQLSLAGWNCALLTTQRGRCTIAALSGGPVYIPFQFSSPTPGSFQAHVAVSSDGDAVSANDSVDLAINVQTYLDIAITATTRDQVFVVGVPKDVNLTVSTGGRAVTGAHAKVASHLPELEIVAMSARGTPCQAESWGYDCDLGDLPANASVPVTVRYSAMSSNVSESIPVCAQIDRDSNHDNDCYELFISTLGMTDVRLQVASSAVRANTGSLFHLPLITVANGADFAGGVHVRVPLPAFATVQDVSTSAGACTGTTVLDCDFQMLAPNASATLDVTLSPTATGTFSSNIELVSENDSTAANNAAAVEVSVVQPPSGNPGNGGPSAGSKGGGGRTEWMMLIILAVLAARRFERLQRVRIGDERHLGSIR